MGLQDNSTLRVEAGIPLPRVNAIKLRATTRDCPYMIASFRRGNPLWLPLNLMAVTQGVGTRNKSENGEKDYFRNIKL
ncbi:hypothetical protein PN36_10120 [Candidatus Thiomargarita nelsonii]|uniref:Uncharacterized protein n=1 Tax=Candidatus Thiomargarita nelsonii TaxID=1003181 RepID=A0A0A6P9J8_9GAMM|nr:hypothetical protein PN36_10120 [Candidatus Thiomargarita nelsonii]